MDATGEEKTDYDKTNAFTAYAVHQDLLLWEATLAMMEMQSSIIQSLESNPDQDNNKSLKK